MSSYHRTHVRYHGGPGSGEGGALDAYPEDPSSLTEDQARAGFAQLQRISEMVEA